MGDERLEELVRRSDHARADKTTVRWLLKDREQVTHVLRGTEWTAQGAGMRATVQRFDGSTNEIFKGYVNDESGAGISVSGYTGTEDLPCFVDITLYGIGATVGSEILNKKIMEALISYYENPTDVLDQTTIDYIENLPTFLKG